MSDAFARAVDRLFADPNISRPAIFTPDGGVPMSVSVILKRPDTDSPLGQLGVTDAEVLADVRVCDLASPKRGDTLTVGPTIYTVQKVRADELRLVWTLDLGE